MVCALKVPTNLSLYAVRSPIIPADILKIGNLSIESSSEAIFAKDTRGIYHSINEAGAQMLGHRGTEVIGHSDADILPAEIAAEFRKTDEHVMATGQGHEREEKGLINGKPETFLTHKTPWRDSAGKIIGVIGVSSIITERKQMEAALENRIVALTRPLDDSAAITFEDLFDLAKIQKLQDEFAAATGVASIISRPDGTPITAPSNFCRLCAKIIRCSEAGRRNCEHSDACLGKHAAHGPSIQPCLSGGLWDAGASITVGDKHIATWLAGQVRDETQSEDKMRAYARDIGADEAVFLAAFREVPAMSRERFGQIAQMLFTLANQLSAMAYQNVQQARFITDRKKIEAERELLIAQLRSSIEQIKTLRGIVPICSGCKKIRDDSGYWQQVEAYVAKHTEAEFSHGLCPDCVQRLYPEYGDPPERSAGQPPPKRATDSPHNAA